MSSAAAEPQNAAPPGAPAGAEAPGIADVRTRPIVLWGTALVVLLVAGWALIAPEAAATQLGAVVGWMGEWFGWFYILLATATLVFVIYMALRYRRVRLGADADRPEYSTFTWACMLFAAGIGTDLMFFAVAEPAAQYLAPPSGDGSTIAAAREATVWTLFHYGITGWGMYTLMGMALGYFAHRRGLPLAVRSALHPIFGRRVQGAIGHSVDIATVLGTIFGVATSLGIGVVMLNVGLDILFGIPQGIPAQVGLVVVAVVTATVSAVSGVDKGIRILSQLNVLLALFLAGWVLVFGDTAFLLRAAVMNIGDFVAMFPGMTLDTLAYDYPADWMNAWTLFFWAWWIAWASFVGMFLARISRGRTIGQFVFGTLTIPFVYIAMWVTMFGNTAVKRIMDGDAAFGEAAMNTPETGFYALLQQFPGEAFIIGLSTFVGLLFYVTSADSGALVMANLSSELPDAETDAKPWVRIFWAAATGILTIAMLIVGGIPALQSATIIMALPFAVVMVLVMAGLHRALYEERRQDEAMRSSMRSLLLSHEAPSAAPGAWRARLAQQFGTVSRRTTDERMDQVVIPALDEVAAELCERGVTAEVVHGGEAAGSVARSAGLVVRASEEGYDDFRYTTRVRRIKAPSYGARMLEADDTSCQLEVVLPGGGSYDVLTYSQERIAHDVLDHYALWHASNTAVASDAVG